MLLTVEFSEWVLGLVALIAAGGLTGLFTLLFKISGDVRAMSVSVVTATTRLDSIEIRLRRMEIKAGTDKHGREYPCDT